MRRWKAWILGALALAGLTAIEGKAEALTMTPPPLTPLRVRLNEPAAPTSETQCYWRRGYHYGWHRHYGWRRHYGLHRRYYGRPRPYGFYRPRYYRPVYHGWHRHYGWRRW